MTLKCPQRFKYTPTATYITHFALLFGQKIVHAQFIMSLKDINFKSPRLAIYFNNDLFYNKSLNNISLGVVPQRDII